MEHRNARVIALGFFDGVHRGHGGLLRCARQRADEIGCAAAVLTFDLHPDNLVAGSPVPLINTRQDRADICRRVYGMDECLFAHFDKHMMHMPWNDFVTDYLVGELGAVHLVCGHDFRFGDGGQGTPELLLARCAELDIGCDVIPKIELAGITVSSTYIRTLIAAGDMERANEFLGHPHCLTGEVVHGKQLGRTIGIPTANLLIPDGILVPAFGVYASLVWIGERSYAAVTNVGVRPTVEDSDLVTVEPWILDYEGDLYGQRIRVEFFRHLRGERKFDGLDALKAEINRNADETRTYFQK